MGNVRKSNKFLKFICWASIIFCPIVLVTSSIGIYLDNKNKIENYKSNVVDNITNSTNTWNIDNISNINKFLDYSKQITYSNFDNFLRTTINNPTETPIHSISTASSIGKLNTFENYYQMESIELIGITNTINTIKENYKNRYTKWKDKKSAWSKTAIKMPSYFAETFGANNQNSSIPITNNINNFSLDNVAISEKHNIFNLASIEINPNDFNFNNGTYKIYRQQYTQRTNNLTNGYQAIEIRVTWANENNKFYIDDSTYDFWIDMLLKPENKDVSRIVVEPANLIIYRENEFIKRERITLNNNSGLNLFGSINGIISFDKWVNSCINENPSNDFDFRESFKTQIKDVIEINIPRIINVVDDDYKKSNKFQEPSLIAPSILYAQKPQGNIDRSWGNHYFDQLERVFVNAKSYAPNISNSFEFNIKYVNPIQEAESFTNALPNTSINNNPNALFSKQFFVCPNLIELKTNNIKSFFENYVFVNTLPLILGYNNNISYSSYERYKKILFLFLPEKESALSTIPNKKTSYGYRLSDLVDHKLGEIKPSTNINQQSSSFLPNVNANNINSYINSYFNYVITNQDKNNTVYKEFNVDQNQWVNINNQSNKNSYHYDVLYGLSDYLSSIVYSFSLLDELLSHPNPFRLNIPDSKLGNYISRIVDYSTGTIVYNSLIRTENGTYSPYPPKLLDNNNFETFILSKQKTTGLSTIDLTFEDWVTNGWTGIDQNIDMVKILRNNAITIDNLFIPKIGIINQNNVVILTNPFINKSLIISIILIAIIAILIFIELFIIIAIIKTPSKYNWAYQQAKDEFGY